MCTSKGTHSENLPALTMDPLIHTVRLPSTADNEDDSSELKLSICERGYFVLGLWDLVSGHEWLEGGEREDQSRRIVIRREQDSRRKKNRKKSSQTYEDRMLQFEK